MTYGKEEDERKKLVEIATGSTFTEVRKKAIDALAAYGVSAIPDILKVVSASTITEARMYGLAKVEELKKKR